MCNQLFSFFMQYNKTLNLILMTSALLSLLIVSTTYSNYVYAQNKFRAKLDADNEVPPVASAAKGVANFKVKDDAINSKINLTGIADVSGAKIFFGKIGQNGDPIVDLLETGEKTERSDGVAIKGNFTASDFEGSMKGKDLSALQSAMAANETYVNIMTSAHPDGEVSGHIYGKGNTTGSQNVTGTQDNNAPVTEQAIDEQSEEELEEEAEEEAEKDAQENADKIGEIDDGDDEDN
jgi:CHRD domain